MGNGRTVVSYDADLGEFRDVMTAVVVESGQALRVGRPADLDAFEVVGGQTARNGEAYLQALDEMNPRCNGIAYGAPCVFDRTEGDSS